VSYIDDNLMTGERVVHRTKLHWIVFSIPAILALLGLVMLGSPGGYIALVLAAIAAVVEHFNVAASEFAVTNKRVIVKTGVITRYTMETLLQKIEGVSIDQGIVGRILEYGTVSVHGTGNTKTASRRIRNPLEFRRHVQEQIEASNGGAAVS
jgi:uncharacterized membrane protein YdbT with pleckstrin-like domain